MEKRVTKTVDAYISAFKDGIRDKAVELGLKGEPTNRLLEYVYDHGRIVFDKDEFAKRKRVKNAISLFERCCAKRANGEQCTRRRKDEEKYCGTHTKGIPHGVLDGPADTLQVSTKVEVWAQDIQGIIYYLDKTGNVYQPEDIVTNKFNPKIIAKYQRKGDAFSIPEFGMTSLDEI